MLFIQNQADKLNISTPVVIFDQPVWYKASGIVAEKKLDIVCWLGGFHILMRFIGSICYVMGGSGLAEVLTEAYAEKSVLHMLSGKAYARAVRGYILVDSALNNMLIEEVMPSREPEHISNLKKTFQDFPKTGHAEKDCSEALAELAKQLDNKKEHLKNSNRTGRLWIQFLEYVDVMKLFIQAERLGDWEMRLTATKSTLNLFSATSHFNYAKSASRYLQSMLKLPEKHPVVYTKFKEKGYHSVRHSDRYWVGLWSDVIIKQVMMRSVKSRGGLTTLENNEQHVELGVSRQNRDVSDLSKILAWFREHNPFEGGPELRSLSTGICNDDTVNCDNSEKVGKEIQEQLHNVNNYLHDAKIKRRFKVKNIESLCNSTKISDKKFVVIKPTALLLRLIAIAQRKNNIERFYSYELTTFAMSL